MSKNRIAAGLAVAAFGVALSVGTAVAADLPGNGCSVPCPPTTGQVLPNAEVNAPAPQVEAVAATSPTAQSSELALTGGDIAGMTLLGAAAVGSGAILVRRGRKRTS